MAQSVTLWSASADTTPRHTYVAYIVFDVVLGCSYQWCESRSQWEQSDGLKIQYGGEPATGTGAVWIPACGLLEGTQPDHPARELWSDDSERSTPGTGKLPFGVINASADRVDADTLVSVFRRSALRQGVNATFCRGIGRIVGLPSERGVGGDINDTASAGQQHRRHFML